MKSEMLGSYIFATFRDQRSCRKIADCNYNKMWWFCLDKKKTLFRKSLNAQFFNKKNLLNMKYLFIVGDFLWKYIIREKQSFNGKCWLTYWLME